MSEQLIKELAVSLIQIYAPTVGKIPSPQGPHRWHEITASDFGPEHDFHTQDHQSLVVFWPDSMAALQWCYAHLPQDMPKFGDRGFLIEREHIKGVIGSARRDGLMSPEDYAEAMNESDQLMTQGDGR